MPRKAKSAEFRSGFSRLHGLEPPELGFLATSLGSPEAFPLRWALEAPSIPCPGEKTVAPARVGCGDNALGQQSGPVS